MPSSAELLTQFRSCLADALLNELLAIQAAAAIEQGVVSQAHLGAIWRSSDYREHASPTPAEQCYAVAA
jgi:hypothetical protein